MSTEVCTRLIQTTVASTVLSRPFQASSSSSTRTQILPDHIDSLSTAICLPIKQPVKSITYSQRTVVLLSCVIVLLFSLTCTLRGSQTLHLTHLGTFALIRKITISQNNSCGLWPSIDITLNTLLHVTSMLKVSLSDPLAS